MKDFSKVISYLKEKKKTISSMESCTGGFIAHSITNIEGASDVFSFGAVTYSNEFKIKMGVSKKTIDQYSVYSMEVAREMASSITSYANSDYGIGVTGKLNRADSNNMFGNDDDIYFCIYDKEKNKYYERKLKAIFHTRLDNKKTILENILEEFQNIIQ